MAELTFKKFKKICELNIGKKYVDECLNFINTGDCIFHSGIVMSQDHIANLYSFRLEISKEAKRIDQRSIKDFERCVIKLNNSASKEIGITTLYTDNFSFLTFYEPVTQEILGVLKSKTTNKLIDIEQRNDDYISKGLSAGSIKYSKGKFVHDWK